MSNSDQKQTRSTPSSLNEDWLSVIIALVIILLSTLGMLGPQGIKIIF